MAPSRTKDQVLQQGSEFCQAKPKAESLEIQKRNGVHYSELPRLPYHDLVRTSIIKTLYFQSHKNTVDSIQQSHQKYYCSI